MGEKHHHIGKPDLEVLVDNDLGSERYLILHNDEVHTFDYVIETLIDIFEMDEIQAEQCTFFVYYKEKYENKKRILH